MSALAGEAQYGDLDADASANMFKFRGCQGIEDVFTQNDFKIYVLKDADIQIDVSNSEFMKNGARSKPVTGYMFLLDVKAGLVNLSDFEEKTRSQIAGIIQGIVERLVAKA